MSPPDPVIPGEAIRLAEVMRDGTHGEFWPHIQEQIRTLIVQAESRFLDTVAADYPTYLQWFSRRQALIQCLTLPDRLIEAAQRPHDAT